MGNFVLTPMKYARRTIAEIKGIIRDYDNRGLDETSLEAAARLGVYREQIHRWRREVMVWEAAGYTDEHVPCAKKTRIRRAGHQNAVEGSTL